MRNLQSDVRAFQVGAGQVELPAVPTFVTAWSLGLTLIKEEVRELEESMQDRDMPAIADGIADGIYVLLWTANALGIDLEPVWNTIQSANMEKVSPAVFREDGKLLKPPGWKHPDIATILEAQGWRKDRDG